MNTRKLNLITEATTAFPGVSINDAILLFLRNRYSSDQGLSDLIARYLYGTGAYNFDGIDDYGALPYRAINPDGDIDIEWVSGPSIGLGTSRTIVSQTLSSVSTSQEFFIFITSVGGVSFRVGGASAGFTMPTYAANTRYRFLLQGTTASISINGVIADTRSFTRGVVREPSAQTIIGAANNAFYYLGALYNVRINGTLWRMADRNQAIQLPEPSGLGAELITPTVLENPAVKGSQWTYLGAGRWQLIGDGSLSELAFINIGAQPAQGFLEFEVESITGSLGCTVNNLARGIFNTVGVKRYFYTDKNETASNGAAVLFKRVGGATSCIIKNISFKPLGTCNPMTLVNVTSDRWQEVPQ